VSEVSAGIWGADNVPNIPNSNDEVLTQSVYVPNIPNSNDEVLTQSVLTQSVSSSSQPVIPSAISSLFTKEPSDGTSDVDVYYVNAFVYI
jgi:hypothetical protein